MASIKAFNQFLALPILLMNCFLLHGQCATLTNKQEGEDLVTAICKHTLHFQVCISSLGSVPGSKTSDVKKLAHIALNVSKTYAEETLSYVRKLKSSSEANVSNNIYVSHCLSDCVEEYSEAKGNLQESAKTLECGDYDKVDTLVSAAMSDAETCEDGFRDIFNGDNDSTSPLTERNLYFSELCSNALAITKLLV